MPYNPDAPDVMTAPFLRDSYNTYPRLYVPPTDEEIAEEEAESEAEAAVMLCELAAIPSAQALFEEPPTSDEVATGALFQRRYFVMLSGLSEDIPIGLFEHPEEAVEFARDVRHNPDIHAATFFDAIEKSTDGILHRDCQWLSVSVIEFSGPVPMCRTVLFDLD